MRPLVICTTGYDETVQTMHYGQAAAAQRRGCQGLPSTDQGGVAC